MAHGRLRIADWLTSDLWRDKRGNMKLQTVHAIFRDGTLLFADPRLAPKGVNEVVLTYLEESPTELKADVHPIKALRGRGKGERLTEKLLESRLEDRKSDTNFIDALLERPVKVPGFRPLGRDASHNGDA